MSLSKHHYDLPVPKNAITYIVQDTESGSHQGVFQGSVDFAVAPNTPIFAAEDGVVFAIRDDSDKYGEDKSFGNEANYITIEHPEEEMSEYMHLAQSSALVEVGDKVKKGQQIAKTGLSGWMFAPHLHFMVFKKIKPEQGFQALEIRFSQPLP